MAIFYFRTVNIEIDVTRLLQLLACFMYFRLWIFSKQFFRLYSTKSGHIFVLSQQMAQNFLLDSRFELH